MRLALTVVAQTLCDYREMTDMRAELSALKSLVGTAPAWEVDGHPADPLELFVDWFREAVAAGVPEPHAMTLSTVGADGIPDARVLILKDVTDDGLWAFASGRNSEKGQQLQAHPAAALTFYWSQQVRSVRIRGRVEAAPHADSAADFRERGVIAKALALAGTQSEPFGDAAERRDRLESARERLEREPELSLADWVVWQLRPVSIEFWQGDPSRNHRRLQYQRGDDGWTSRRLWP